EQSGRLEGLDHIAQEEMVEAIAGPALIESREYSERVTGVTVYERPKVSIEGSGTTWLPEAFSQHLVQAIQTMPDPDLHALREHMIAVLETNQNTPAEIAGEMVPVTPAGLAAITGEIERRETLAAASETEEEVPDKD